jgi:peptidoglycan/xylan/chitin deacetylase (PgdA/CDA1 family)
MSRIPILCYHNIGPPPAGTPFKLLHVAEAKLERQLWALRRLGVRGVSMAEGFGQLGAAARSNLVVLTFDDGYRDTLTAALPLLRRYGFRATCYVVSDRIGGQNSWDDDAGAGGTPLMSRAEIGLWLEAGMEIASHSCSHPRLQKLAPQDALQEISDSRATLRQLFGVAVDHFAYPFGGFTPGIIQSVKQCGYASAVTTEPGIAQGSDDVHRLPRVLVHGERGLARFLLQVAPHYEDVRHGRGLFTR